MLYSFTLVNLMAMFLPPTLMVWSTAPPVLFISSTTVPPAEAKPRSISVVSDMAPAMPVVVPSLMRMNPPTPSEKVTPLPLDGSRMVELTFAAPTRMALTGKIGPLGPSGSRSVICSKAKSPLRVKVGVLPSPTSTSMSIEPARRRKGPAARLSVTLSPSSSIPSTPLLSRPSPSTTNSSLTGAGMLLIWNCSAPDIVTPSKTRSGSSSVKLAAIP